MFTVHLRQTSTRCVMDTGLDPQGYPFSFCWLICQFVKCLLAPCGHAFKPLCVSVVCADICFRFHSLQPRCRVPQTFWEWGLQESRFHSHRYSLQQHISQEYIFPKPFFFSVFFFFLFLYLVLCVVLEVFDNRSANCAALQKYLVMVVSGERAR